MKRHLLAFFALASTAFATPTQATVEAYAKKQPCPPTFRDALETQKVCDAVLNSAKSHAWVKVG